MIDYQADRDSGIVNVKGHPAWTELTPEQTRALAEKLNDAADYADPEVDDA